MPQFYKQQFKTTKSNQINYYVHNFRYFVLLNNWHPISPLWVTSKSKNILNSDLEM